MENSDDPLGSVRKRDQSLSDGIPSPCPASGARYIWIGVLIVLVMIEGLLMGHFGHPDIPTHVLVVNLDYRRAVTTSLVGPGPLEVFQKAGAAAAKLAADLVAHLEIRILSKKARVTLLRWKIDAGRGIAFDDFESFHDFPRAGHES